MMMGFGFIAMLLFWGLILALLVGGGVLAFRGWGGTHAPAGGHPATARQILDERFARGEISKQEYEDIRGRIG